MKKILILSILFAFAADSFAAQTSKRVQWWQIRMQNLSEEKNALMHSDIYPLLQRSFDERIQQSEQMIASINETTGGSPVGNGTINSNEELHALIHRECESSFAALCYEKLLIGGSSADWQSKAADFMNEALSESSRRITGKSNDFFSAKLSARYCTPEYRKYLIFELFAGTLMQKEEALSADFQALVSAEVSRAAAGGKITGKTVADACARVSSEFDIEARLKPLQSAFDRAWSANTPISFAEMRLAALKKGEPFLIHTGSSLESADNAAEKYEDLDQEFFSNLDAHLFPGRIKNISGKETQGIKFNPDADIQTVITDIDADRRSAIAAIKGVEDETDKVSLSKKHLAAIDSVIPASAAEKTEKRNTLMRYAGDSASFFAWVCAIKKTNSSLALDLFKTRLKRNREYLSFLSSLEASASSCDLQSLQYKRYLAARAKSATFIKSVSYSAGIEKQLRERFKPSDLSAATEESAQFHKFETSVSADIATVRKDRNAERAQNNAAEKKDADLMAGAIARSELNALSDSLTLLMNQYRTLSYTTQSLRDYAVLFQSLSDKVKAGSISEDLYTVLKNRTLTPLLSSYDAKRFAGERRAASYFAKNIIAESARLKQLSDYYVRMKLAERTDRGAEVKQLLAPPYVVQIGAWKMNENNFDEIDKKAAALLIQQINRMRTQRGSASMVSDTAYDIPGEGISVMVPDGWKEQPGGALNGSAAEFSSETETPVFKVYTMPCSKVDAYDAFERWGKDLHLSIVKTGSGTAPDCSYSWMVAQTKLKKIVKAYARYNDGKLIIVAGECDKPKYRSFAGRIESMFLSVKLK